MLLRTKEFVPGTVLIVLTLLLGLCRTGLAQAPANDNFANAIPLYGSSVTFTGTLANATFEAGESPIVSYYVGNKSVWWSWTATNSTSVMIRLLQRSEDKVAAFAVYDVTNVSQVVDSSQIDWNLLDRKAYRYLAFSATQGKTYHIRVSGEYDSDPKFTLQLIANNGPAILAPPQNQVVNGNASVVFDVTAAGIQPLKYQWQFQGKALLGETAPALMVHRVGPVQEGSYSVVVSNVSGITTSSVANLTLSGTNALPALTALNVPNTNRFFFTLAGETGKRYQIDRAAYPTSFLRWPRFGPEDAINWPPAFFTVVNDSSTSTFAILRDQPQQFFQPSLHPEICVAHLKAIDAAIKLWWIEHKASVVAAVAPSDVIPYLKSTEDFVCPSGGTIFFDSYILSTVTAHPICIKVPTLHLLP